MLLTIALIFAGSLIFCLLIGPYLQKIAKEQTRDPKDVNPCIPKEETEESDSCYADE
jgi:hypothetical protein